jgi:hypothetical protein
MSSHEKLHNVNRLGAMAIAAILGAVVAFVAVQLARPGARASGPVIVHGPPGPTLADPLAAPGRQMSMAAAVSALGVSVPLPTTSAVQPADVGAVWEGSYGGSRNMAVTYPAQGLIIYYNRLGFNVTDPSPMYQQDAAQIPSAHVVQLNPTTPALVIAQNSDMTGANFGVVAFVVNGIEVQVRGHTDETSLQAIAQSILTHWPSASSSSSPSGTSRVPRS